MKRKILILAGVVMASLAMSTSVFAAQGSGDVNKSGDLDINDAALILSLALDKDYSTTNAADPSGVPYAWEEANADGDAPFEDTDEITANDAAYVYNKVMNGTQLYLKLTSGGGLSFKEQVALTDKVVDITDRVLLAASDSAYATQINKRKTFINNAIDNVKFYSGSEEIGDVELREPAGWEIFAAALAPVVVEGKDFNELEIGYVDVDYDWISNEYSLAKEIIKSDATYADLYQTYENVVTITKGKYGIGMAYTAPGATEETSLYAKLLGDEDAATMISLITDNNLQYYNDVTVGDYQAVFGDYADLIVNATKLKVELVEE